MTLCVCVHMFLYEDMSFRRGELARKNVRNTEEKRTCKSNAYAHRTKEQRLSLWLDCRDAVHLLHLEQLLVGESGAEAHVRGEIVELHTSTSKINTNETYALVPSTWLTRSCFAHILVGGSYFGRRYVPITD